MHIWLLLNSDTTHSNLNLLTFLRSCWGALGALLAKESSSRQFGWRMSISVGISNGSSSDGSLGPWIGPAYLLYYASLICSPGPLHFLLGHLILSPWSNKGYITHPQICFIIYEVRGVFDYGIIDDDYIIIFCTYVIK